MVGLGGLEPPTSRLSGVRSNHLSYKPIYRTSIVFQNVCSMKSQSDYKLIVQKLKSP